MPDAFFATICVILHTPELIEEDGQPDSNVVGYYRNFALNAFSIQNAKEIISDDLDDGPIDWSDSTLREVDPTSLDPAIAIHHLGEIGIWYRSGRAYFPSDSEPREHSIILADRRRKGKASEMPLKNQKLNPFQALLAILAVGTLAGVVYGVYLAGSHLWHQKQIKAGIPVYLSHLRAQRDALSQAIERYHSQLGFYPPNHSTNRTQRATINPLYYELVGTRMNPEFKTFGVPTAKETINPDRMANLFNMRSFSNSLTFPSWPTNFISGGGFAAREEDDIMMVGYSIPDELSPDIDDGFQITTWRYATDPAEHNPGKFDIWIEVDVLGQHVVVGNWAEVR